MRTPRPVELAVLASFTMLALSNSGAVAQDGAQARPAYCAGSWYPGKPSELTAHVDDLIARASPPPIPDRPIAIISPHAGYRYSAPTAAAAYACLRGQTYSRVIVLAFSHRNAGMYRGVDVPKDLTAYTTPLGEVPLDREVCRRLAGQSGFTSIPGVDRGEHSLELQLPFLQRTLKEFTLVPLLVGQMSDAECTRAAQALVPCVDEHTLLVVSTDFTHYGADFGYEPFTEDVENKLRELAEQAAGPLLRCDYDGFAEHLSKTGDTICGRGPVALLLRMLAMRGGADGVRAAFDTSGHMTGDWSTSVTYQSFVFTRRAAALGSAERIELLKIARQTVATFLKGEALPTLDAEKLPAKLRTDGACFVTLQNAGQLRGCIGNMVAQGPLCQAVIRNAVSACQDPRFTTNPVTAKELDQLRIEISCLSPMARVKRTQEIVIGRHGLLIALGGQQGVLLPQVAYERGWTRAEFLLQTCRKAGLPSDAWKRPEAELYSFEAEVFGEPEP